MLGMGHPRSCPMHLHALCCCHHAAAAPVTCQPCGVDLAIPGHCSGRMGRDQCWQWALPSPAGHCLYQGCQDCTYQLGQRAWARISCAGSTMAILPLSTSIQGATFILDMGVREGSIVPGLSTSPCSCLLCAHRVGWHPLGIENTMGAQTGLMGGWKQQQGAGSRAGQRALVLPARESAGMGHFSFSSLPDSLAQKFM